MCVTLNEGYLRSANRGSHNFIQIFNQNITYQPSMKKRIFFGLSFLLFFLDCRSTNLLRLFSGNLPAILFLCLTFFFVLHFVHIAKLKKANFLNDFFISLTAFARVTSILTLFSKRS